MRLAKQLCAGSCFSLGLSLWACVLMMTVEGAHRSALGQRLNALPGPAVMVFQEDGIHNLGDQVIRCQPGEKVGIWAERRASLRISHVVVEDCEVGIVVTGGTLQTPPSETTRRAAEPTSTHISHVRVRATSIGFFLAGSGGVADHNSVEGAGYGFVVTGDDQVLTNNQSNNNLKDGFLITGDRNLLEGNEARGNGGIGIHVARMVPMVRPHRVLPFIQDQGLGNVIRGNTALGNKRDLVEFAECEPPPYPPLENEWVNNIFRTRRPKCIE